MNNTTTERIYRDERLEGLEIRNSGGATFNIWVEGERESYHNENGWCNVDCFTIYPEGNSHSANSAEQIAIEHFDDLVEEWEVA